MALQLEHAPPFVFPAVCCLKFYYFNAILLIIVLQALIPALISTKSGDNAEVVLRVTDDALRFLRQEVKITEDLYNSALLAAKCQEQELNEARANLNEAESAAIQLRKLYDSDSEDSESDTISNDSAEVKAG
jgi:5-bromo-4-chloroindolyl phosphate hydrolysis protein